MAAETTGHIISVVARKFDIHPQTLRAYERAGLLQPSRSEGNTRLYSEADLARLRLILGLRRELGVNLAGVEVILNMREKMELMQESLGRLLELLSSRTGPEVDWIREKVREALVPAAPSKLARFHETDPT